MRGMVSNNPDVSIVDNPGWADQMDEYKGNTYEFEEYPYNKKWVTIVDSPSSWKFVKEWIVFEDEGICHNCTNKNCLNCDKAE